MTNGSQTEPLPNHSHDFTVNFQSIIAAQLLIALCRGGQLGSLPDAWVSDFRSSHSAVPDPPREPGSLLHLPVPERNLGLQVWGAALIHGRWQALLPTLPPGPQVSKLRKSV